MASAPVTPPSAPVPAPAVAPPVPRPPDEPPVFRTAPLPPPFPLASSPLPPPDAASSVPASGPGLFPPPESSLHATPKAAAAMTTQSALARRTKVLRPTPASRYPMIPQHIALLPIRGRRLGAKSLL